jgi:hypothetical protein
MTRAPRSIATGAGEPRLLVITLMIATLIPCHAGRAAAGPRWLFPSIIFVLITAMLLLDQAAYRSRSDTYAGCGLASPSSGASTAYAALASPKRWSWARQRSPTRRASCSEPAGWWVAILITFTMVYWELDIVVRERAHTQRQLPDLAFPRIEPSIARPGAANLYRLSVPGTHEQPASVPRMSAPCALGEIHHGLQSLASLVIIGLVLARAVNIFRE